MNRDPSSPVRPSLAGREAPSSYGRWKPPPNDGLDVRGFELRVHADTRTQNRPTPSAHLPHASTFLVRQVNGSGAGNSTVIAIEGLQLSHVYRCAAGVDADVGYSAVEVGCPHSSAFTFEARCSNDMIFIVPENHNIKFGIILCFRNLKYRAIPGTLSMIEKQNA